MAKENVVLVICALKKEYEALKNKVREGKDEEIAGIKGIMFPIPSGKAFAFQGRVGKVNTALDIGKLAASVEIKAIINSGVGGSINETVKPLDVVVANKVAYHDVDLTAFGNPLGQMDKEPLWFETDNEFIESSLPDTRICSGRVTRGCSISSISLSAASLPRALVFCW